MASRKVLFRLEGYAGDSTEKGYPGCFDVLDWGLGRRDGKPSDQREFWVMLRSSSASTGLSNARTSGKTFGMGTIILLDDGREVFTPRQFPDIFVSQHQAAGAADIVSFSGRKLPPGVRSGNDDRNANHPS